MSELLCLDEFGNHGVRKITVTQTMNGLFLMQCRCGAEFYGSDSYVECVRKHAEAHQRVCEYQEPSDG